MATFFFANKRAGAIQPGFFCFAELQQKCSDRERNFKVKGQNRILNFYFRRYNCKCFCKKIKMYICVLFGYDYESEIGNVRSVVFFLDC